MTSAFAIALAFRCSRCAATARLGVFVITPVLLILARR